MKNSDPGRPEGHYYEKEANCHSIKQRNWSFSSVNREFLSRLTEVMSR